MAGVKLTDAGGQMMLDIVFGDADPDTSFECVLFVDTNAVGDNGVAVSHTEVTGGGYAQQTIDDVATIGLSTGGVPMMTFPQVNFNFTGAVTNGSIKGYEVVGVPSNVTYFEEVFATPVVPAAGDILPIIPRCLLGNGTPL